MKRKQIGILVPGKVSCKFTNNNVAESASNHAIRGNEQEMHNFDNILNRQDRHCLWDCRRRDRSLRHMVVGAFTKLCLSR